MKNLFSRQTVLFIGFSIAIVDQISKLLIVNRLSYFEKIQFIPYVINLYLVKNTGAAFSLFPNSTLPLTILSILVTFLLISWIWKNQPFSLSRAIGISFLLGGTIGNGIDRIRLNYVIDFIELIPINFPIFNIADISINIAMAMIFVDIFRKKGIKK